MALIIWEALDKTLNPCDSVSSSVKPKKKKKRGKGGRGGNIYAT